PFSGPRVAVPRLRLSDLGRGHRCDVRFQRGASAGHRLGNDFPKFGRSRSLRSWVQMIPFFKTRRSPAEQTVPQIRFLCEQDGESERILKEALTNLFRGATPVARAYLARADFGSGQSTGVVLALRTFSPPDKSLVERVGAIFSSIFHE